MSVIEQTAQMTLDEFIERYAKEPFELVNGEIRPLMPNVTIHQLTLRALFVLLYNHCIANSLGEVIFELPVVETYGSNWVKGSRTPDLMFISAEKWAKYTAETEDWKGKPSLVVPDLAVEIVSPNDSYTDIQEKVDEYLEKGVKLIWVMDPMRKRVRVYQGQRLVTLGKNDTLTGGDLLPGFVIDLNELFK